MTYSPNWQDTLGPDGQVLARRIVRNRPRSSHGWAHGGQGDNTPVKSAQLKEAERKLAEARKAGVVVCALNINDKTAAKELCDVIGIKDLIEEHTTTIERLSQ